MKYCYCWREGSKEQECRGRLECAEERDEELSNVLHILETDTYPAFILLGC